LIDDQFVAGDRMLSGYRGPVNVSQAALTVQLRLIEDGRSALWGNRNTNSRHSRRVDALYQIVDILRCLLRVHRSSARRNR
jgi:hypothetical protein